MFRKIWQSTMIAMARSGALKRAMQSWAPASSLAKRYVGDRTVAEVIAVAQCLSEWGITASLYYMGEYHESPEVVRENTRRKIDLVQALGRTDLDVHVSVDPTQIGLTLDKELCRENAVAIASEVRRFSNRPGRHCMMLDMEDCTTTDATISLHDELRARGLPVAVTLQAYLRRSEADLEALIAAGAFVRLVHGAFAEGPKQAFSSVAEVKHNYRRLADLMLSEEARRRGLYPAFATHDEKLHDHIVATARERGRSGDEFEFEMLYGARPQVEKDLLHRGYSLRLYLPFGEDWWPYAIRRIGENPRNAYMLARALFRR